MEIKISILNRTTKKIRYENLASIDEFMFADLDDQIQQLLLPNEWVSNVTFLTILSCIT